MEILDARRLTGLSADGDAPGVMLELRAEGAESLEAGLARLSGDLEALLPAPRVRVRRWADGRSASLTFEAPIDRLYAAVALGERLAVATGDEPPETRRARETARFAAEAEAEGNPALLELQARARDLGVPFLWDDDAVSLGFGESARVFAPDALPAAESLDWETFRDLPKVLITGTNGKTTTSRMLARILRVAGRRVGASSTDALTLDERPFDKGDWTGPGAARTILRHPEVEVAVLETARGGMLRRGLGVTGVDAAAVTNVGADHLGEYGVEDVAGMARVKATVWRAVGPSGKRVLNAECPASVDAATALSVAEGASILCPARWVLVSTAPADPTLSAHRARGGQVWYAAGRAIWFGQGDHDLKVMPVADIPAAWGGLARHNVSNALTAAALAHALGLPLEAIADGLRTFGARPEDNPGRAELWRVEAARLLLDFGHNAHGLGALSPLIAGLRGAGRLSVSVGQAGDRGPDETAAMAEAVAAMTPDQVIIRGLPGYERGRQKGEMEAMLAEALGALGVSSAIADDEVSALEAGLAWAEPGDLLVHLVHLERDAVRARLDALGATPAGQEWGARAGASR